MHSGVTFVVLSGICLLTACFAQINIKQNVIYAIVPLHQLEGSHSLDVEKMHGGPITTLNYP